MNWIESCRWLIAPSRLLVGVGVNTVLQSTALILLALAAGKLLRRRGAAYESMLLRAVLIGVLICPIGSVMMRMLGVGTITLALPEPLQGLRTDKTALPQNTSAQVERTGRFHAMNERLDPTEDASEPVHNQPVPVSKLPALAAPGVASIHLEASTATTASARRLKAWASAYVVVALLWALVSLILLLRLAILHLRLVALLRSSQPAGDWAGALCRELSESLAVAAPAIRVSERTGTPCLVGLVRPVILIPASSIVEPATLRHILLHELAHLVRRDCLWNLLGHLATALFFYQPLLLVLRRNMEQASEEVCDDHVVQWGRCRRDYAACLVDLAERFAPAGVDAMLSTGIVSFRSSIGRRVQRILDGSRRLSLHCGRFAIGAASSLVILGVISSGLIGFGATGPAQHAATTQPAGNQVGPDSLAWRLLRTWHSENALRGLAPRLGKAILPSRRKDPIWTGSNDGGAIDLEISIEKGEPGEIFIGFFAEPDWSHEPVQVRSFPGPGRYHLDKLPLGKYHVGAMIGAPPNVSALGIDDSWPQPIDLASQANSVRVLVSSDFYKHGSGTYGHEFWAKCFMGHWDNVRPANLLRGRTIGPDGQPVPFATIQIREHKVDRGIGEGIAAPDVGSDDQGNYYFDQIEWPYRVGALRYDLISSALGQRSQYLAYNKVLEGPQTVDFKFPPWPAGSATLTGRAVDQSGEPIREFTLSASTWPEYQAKQEKPSDEFFPVIDYRVPVLSSDGRFKLTGLPGGDYRIWVMPFEAQGYEFHKGPTKHLSDGQSADITVTLIAKGLQVFYGRALFEDGQPVYPASPPWPNANSFVRYRDVKFRRGDFMASYGGEIQPDGQFHVSLQRQEIDAIKSGRGQLDILYPSVEEKNMSYPVGTFPFENLSTDPAKAGVVKVPRPKADAPSASKDGEASAPAYLGQTLQNFELLGTDGRTYRLSSLKDQPVLLNIFTTYGSLTQRENFSHLKELAHLHAGVGLAVWAISREEKAASVERWASRNQSPIPVLIDEEGKVTRQFGGNIRKLPFVMNILLDRTHKIIYASEGFNDEKLAALVREIEKVLQPRQLKDDRP